ncbi:glycosyltransferase family 2 protein [Herbiconiux sp. 11R-BC]|uniref:glycosyltransferase family 2 protein n=1 Tax=Herbiconiux sp. 11R-BC TaxID=3111637 RepID=UPI003BFB75A4
MRLAMTLMVRDEADIVGAMIDHHLAQGVDTLIVTDNGSVDGTAEILQRYADQGLIDLRHDPVHRKQQSPVVTQMARDAATMYGADWVINADADEFFLPVDRSLTLREVFTRLDKSLAAFLVPVTNLTGPPAASGTGIGRLVYRDQRPVAALRATGLRDHPTADAVHVGDPSIEVIQGNHFVSLASQGLPPEELAIEVLHLPWRSWKQYAQKVENAGRAYDSNPELTPSPHHHGMRDWARLQAGALLPFYLLRHPDAGELAAGLAAGHFVEDRVLAEYLASPEPDAPLDPETLTLFERFAPALRDAEARSFAASTAAEEKRLADLEEQSAAMQAVYDALEAEKELLIGEKNHLLGEVLTLTERQRLTEVHAKSLETSLEQLSGRFEVRAGRKLRRIVRRAG